MKRVLEFALNEMNTIKQNESENIQDGGYKINKHKYALLCMPNQLIENFEMTLSEYKIKHRTLLFLIEKELVR